MPGSREQRLNLAANELPLLTGDGMAWWVTNDVGNAHRRTGSAPIGIEVQTSAFAYNLPGDLGNATFYRYRLVYRGATPITGLHVGFFADFDLGGALDDYVGSDSVSGLVYGYNADNDDEGSGGYGTAPPALGLMFIGSPPAPADGRDNDRDGRTDEPGETLGTTVARALYRDGVTTLGFPTTSTEVYNTLRGLFKYGDPVTEGRRGHNPGVAGARPAPFMFAGDPVQGAYWSMRNTDGSGAAESRYDQRMLVASGPTSLVPGASAEYTVAILWARGANNLDSAARLIALARGFATSVPAEPETAVPDGLTLRVGPNPAGARATVAYRLPAPGRVRVRLAVYDLLGREVALLADGDLAAGAHEATLDARPLPAGAYFVRLATEQGVVTSSLIRAR